MTVTNQGTAGWFNIRPIGIIVVAASYIGGVLGLRLLVPTCLHEPCSSEGVGSTIIVWGSDFFVAVWAFVFGAHLLFGKKSTRKSGILAQTLISGSFALKGIINLMLPNNGTPDYMGMVAFWVVWGISSLFLTLSAACLVILAIEAANRRAKTEEAPMWSIHCELGTWIVNVSEIFLWLFFAILWVPMGLLFHDAAKQKPERIWGLSTPLAAMLAAVFQWSGGSIYFVAVAVTVWIRQWTGTSDETFLELWGKVYGVEIFHLGILLTIYCAHNIAWSLTIPPYQERRTKQVSDENLRLALAADETGNAAISKKVRFAGETLIVLKSMDNMEKGISPKQDDGTSSAASSAENTNMERYILSLTLKIPLDETEGASTILIDGRGDDPMQSTTTTSPAAPISSASSASSSSASSVEATATATPDTDVPQCEYSLLGAAEKVEKVSPDTGVDETKGSAEPLSVDS